MAKPPRQNGKPSRSAKVRITAPCGHRLRFSESLIEFVASRPVRDRRRGFRLGDWIASLDDVTLGHLNTLSGQVTNGIDIDRLPEPAGEDLLSVAIHAAAAERGTREIQSDPEQIMLWLASLHIGANLEKLRRDGLVEIGERTSITNGKAAVTFTDEGMARLDQVRAELGAWMN